MPRRKADPIVLKNIFDAYDQVEDKTSFGNLGRIFRHFAEKKEKEKMEELLEDFDSELSQRLKALKPVEQAGNLANIPMKTWEKMPINFKLRLEERLKPAKIHSAVWFDLSLLLKDEGFLFDGYIAPYELFCVDKITYKILFYLGSDYRLYKNDEQKIDMNKTLFKYDKEGNRINDIEEKYE